MKQIWKASAIVMMVFIMLMTAMVSGCGKQDVASFETVETARMQVNENALYNAKAFRTSHPEYDNFSIETRGDSTQSEKCPQGDGWASIDLVQIDQNIKAELKCSTISAATGCMTDKDFKSRTYANENNQCNSAVPFPVPKIQK